MLDKKWQTRIFYVIAGILLLLIIQKFTGINKPVVGGTDYKKVALNFINNDANISKRVGTIKAIRHIGVGGSSGTISHNAFSITGSEYTAYCHVSLKRKKGEKNWYVDEVSLMVDGHDYAIPVSRR